MYSVPEHPSTASNYTYSKIYQPFVSVAWTQHASSHYLHKYSLCSGTTFHPSTYPSGLGSNATLISSQGPIKTGSHDTLTGDVSFHRTAVLITTIIGFMSVQADTDSLLTYPPSHISRALWTTQSPLTWPTVPNWKAISLLPRVAHNSKDICLFSAAS